MLGILVELAISWLLLWLVEKKNLAVLGLFPSASRLKGFFLCFLLATFCVLLQIFLRIQFFKEQYQLNPQLDFKLIWKGFQWNLVSVLYEELIFRGALLYILMRRWGRQQGIVVSAIAFGVYHWFSYNLFGNVTAMVYFFFITGIMGLVLAYAYAKTLSMYVAIGFHLGWNFMMGFVFSNGPIGKGVWSLAKDRPVVTVSWFTYYTITLLPILIAFLSAYLAVRLWPAKIKDDMFVRQNKTARP